MGYRTVVILNNDLSSQWSNDADLGKKIMRAGNEAASSKDPERSHFGYGRVVECAHADVQTVGIIDSLTLVPLTHGHWRAQEAQEDLKLRMLKEAARAMGYRIVKLPKEKAETGD